MTQDGADADTVAVPSRDSNNSSGRSTPEMHRRTVISSHPQGAGGALDPNRPLSQSLDNPLYANLENVSNNPCLCFCCLWLLQSQFNFFYFYQFM